MCRCALCHLGFISVENVNRQSKARSEVEGLKVKLEEATRRLTEIELSKEPGDLFQKTVSNLVGLGIPGLILLAVIATTGYAGAAAITTALATLGGPFGMLGGIAALVAMGFASNRSEE